MENKRSLSPASCTHEQLAKKLRGPVNGLNFHQKCIHCESMFHRWLECTNVCTHCGDVHACRRCPRLDVSCYIPGGFKIRVPKSSVDVYTKADSVLGVNLPSALAVEHIMSDGSQSVSSFDPVIKVEENEDPTSAAAAESTAHTRSMNEGINPARAAMIASAHMPRPIEQLQPIDGFGPQRFGSNNLPKPSTSIAPFTVQPPGQVMSTNDGINPARAAMIVSTPMAHFPAPPAAFQPTPGLGPLHSGSNNIPLGTRKPIGRPTTVEAPPPPKTTPITLARADMNAPTRVTRSATAKAREYAQPMPSFEGINPARTSMIAETPTTLAPMRKMPQQKLKPTVGGGPQKIGSNDMPLDTRSAEAEGQLPQLQLQGQVMQPQSSAKDAAQRDRNREHAEWRVLESRIREAVRKTAASGKPFNGKASRKSANARLQAALGYLKEMILGEPIRKTVPRSTELKGLPSEENGDVAFSQAGVPSNRASMPIPVNASDEVGTGISNMSVNEDSSLNRIIEEAFSRHQRRMMGMPGTLDSTLERMVQEKIDEIVYGKEAGNNGPSGLD